MSNITQILESSKQVINRSRDCVFQSQLIIFRKEMSLINVYVSEDKLTYRLPNIKLAESCISMAEKIIAKHNLYTLEAFHQNYATTLVIRRIAA